MEKESQEEGFVKFKATGMLIFISFVLHLSAIGAGIYMTTSATYKHDALQQVSFFIIPSDEYCFYKWSDLN